MVFWMFSYKELTHAGSNSVGMFVLFSQFVHVAIMGDFFYYYAIRSVNCVACFLSCSFFFGFANDAICLSASKCRAHGLNASVSARARMN